MWLLVVLLLVSSCARSWSSCHLPHLLTDPGLYAQGSRGVAGPRHVCQPDIIPDFFSVNYHAGLQKCSLQQVLQLLDAVGPDNLHIAQELFRNMPAPLLEQVVFTPTLRTARIWRHPLIIPLALLVLEQRSYCDISNMTTSLYSQFSHHLPFMKDFSASSSYSLFEADIDSLHNFFVAFLESGVKSEQMRSEKSAELVFAALHEKLLPEPDQLTMGMLLENSLTNIIRSASPEFLQHLSPYFINKMFASEDASVADWVSQNAAVGSRLLHILEDALKSGNRVGFQSRNRLASQAVLFNKDYIAIFKNYLDPSNFHRYFDRDDMEVSDFKWPPAAATSDPYRGSLVVGYFLRSAWGKLHQPAGKLGNQFLHQSYCHLTVQQVHLLASTKHKLDISGFLPACRNAAKQNILAQYLLTMTQNVYQSLSATDLDRFSWTLPGIDWTRFKSVTSFDAENFLLNSDGGAHSQCEFCTSAQKYVMYHKIQESLHPENLPAHSIHLLIPFSPIAPEQLMEVPFKRLARFQKLWLLDTGSIEGDAAQILLPPSELSVSSPFRLLHLLADSSDASRYDLYGESVLGMLRRKVAASPLDALGVFGVRQMPIDVLLQFRPRDLGVDKRVCREFFSRIGATDRVLELLAIERADLVRYYTATCMESNGLEERDFIVLDRLVCDVPSEELEATESEVIVKSLHFFSRCCVRLASSRVIKRVLGPLKSWKPFWISDLGSQLCSVVHHSELRDSLDGRFKGLDMVAGIHSPNERCLSAEMAHLTGFDGSRWERSNCLQTLSSLVTEKLTIPPSQFMGWQQACAFSDPNDLQRGGTPRSLDTCAAIMTLGRGVKFLPLDRLEALSDCEIESCVHYFGESSFLTRDQRQYLLKRVSSIRGYGDSVPPLSALVELGNLLTALNSSQMEELDVAPDVVMQMAGVAWEPWQRDALFARVVPRLDSQSMAAELLALGDVGCSAGREFFDHFTPEQFLSLIAVLRDYSRCPLPFYRSVLERFLRDQRVHSSLPPYQVAFLGNILVAVDATSQLIDSQNVHEVNEFVLSKADDDSAQAFLPYLERMTRRQLLAFVRNPALHQSQQSLILRRLGVFTGPLDTLYSHEFHPETPLVHSSTHHSRTQEDSAGPATTTFPVQNSQFQLQSVVYIVYESSAWLPLPILLNLLPRLLIN